jgi:hypothetical protein
MSPALSLRSLSSMLGCLFVSGALVACGGSDDSSTAPAGDAAATQERTDAGPEEAAESAEAPTRVLGGQTTLRLDRDVRRVLDATGITVGPAGAARWRGDAIVLPITEGRLDLDTTSGEIRHSGGIRLSAAGRSVDARDLVVQPDTGAVTAVIGERRVRLFFADPGSAKLPQQTDVIELPAKVKFAEQAVRTLNERFGVDALSGGLSVGDLTIRAKRP